MYIYNEAELFSNVTISLKSTLLYMHLNYIILIMNISGLGSNCANLRDETIFELASAHSNGARHMATVPHSAQLARYK